MKYSCIWAASHQRSLTRKGGVTLEWQLPSQSLSTINCVVNRGRRVPTTIPKSSQKMYPLSFLIINHFINSLLPSVFSHMRHRLPASRHPLSDGRRSVPRRRRLRTDPKAAGHAGMPAGTMSRFHHTATQHVETYSDADVSAIAAEITIGYTVEDRVMDNGKEWWWLLV